MKTIINVKMNDKVSFKFTWGEKGSFIRHIGTIVQPDERSDFTGVVRLDGAKKTNMVRQGKAVWESQTIVPSFIKDALDYMFAKYADRLSLGLEFNVTCFINGSQPTQDGIPENSIDTSWKVKLPKGAPKTAIGVTVATDTSADDAARDVLGL